MLFHVTPAGSCTVCERQQKYLSPWCSHSTSFSVSAVFMHPVSCAFRSGLIPMSSLLPQLAINPSHAMCSQHRMIAIRTIATFCSGLSKRMGSSSMPFLQDPGTTAALAIALGGTESVPSGVTDTSCMRQCKVGKEQSNRTHVNSRCRQHVHRPFRCFQCHMLQHAYGRLLSSQ